MKSFLKKALVISAISIAPVAFAADMTGAGATFPYPIYAKWAEAYKAKTGSNLNYQSIGSSGGIKQIKAKTVDFGASDAPVKFEDLEKDGLLQFPAIIGGVVPVMNVDGVKPAAVFTWRITSVNVSVAGSLHQHASHERLEHLRIGIINFFRIGV